jgi:hypothetical protein
MSYIIVTGRSCDIDLNAHAPTEDKCDYAKDSFYLILTDGRKVSNLFYFPTISPFQVLASSSPSF